MNRVIAAKVDNETARAHWVMSRAQSDRAFRAARGHSRLVRLLRVTIPVAIVVMLVGAFLVSYFNPARMLKALPVNLDNLVVSGTKVTMEKPRLSGFTKDQRAYEFVAEAAAQDLTKPDFVELRNIDAKVQMEDNTTMKMTAATGLYDTKKETLKLEQQIFLSSDSGYKGRLTEALVDVRTGNVVSEKPVELEMLQGILNAKRLEITNSGDIIRFENGVNLTVMLNGQPLPKEKIPAR
ncbi:LPS export ABC transporter periplasmic protein LptC [Undibacter mobilis]|uniref:LPS export ABC transporter periplasmic protein LptC n=1 Tax=Undibacter mobilis TaxID=2292256 RepID=A0A371B9A8_9BRAD|nr:LPS export ABC transporter periplasmic protein LptC [Undibacter mobilis]RDV04122.1 LPS export ABC transporter periplasmic protein LptC [Undibacter mobilis]